MKLLPIYLMTSMVVVMFILYIIYPEPVVMVKYPDPKEEFSDVYVDDNNVCYKYKRNEINSLPESASVSESVAN